MHACPCCGEYTLGETGGFEICEICHWEDDSLQRDDPDYAGGANTMSLNQARRAYRSGLPVT